MKTHLICVILSVLGVQRVYAENKPDSHKIGPALMLLEQYLVSMDLSKGSATFPIIKDTYNTYVANLRLNPNIPSKAIDDLITKYSGRNPLRNGDLEHLERVLKKYVDPTTPQEQRVGIEFILPNLIDNLRKNYPPHQVNAIIRQYTTGQNKLCEKLPFQDAYLRCSDGEFCRLVSGTEKDALQISYPAKVFEGTKGSSAPSQGGLPAPTAPSNAKGAP